jgi:hypothetical protein
MQLLSCTNSIRASNARGETRECDSGIGEGMLARCGGQLQIFLSLLVLKWSLVLEGFCREVRGHLNLAGQVQGINARAARTLSRPN